MRAGKSLLQYVFNGVPGDGVIVCKQDFLHDSSGGYLLCQPGPPMVLLRSMNDACFIRTGAASRREVLPFFLLRSNNVKLPHHINSKTGD